MTRTFYNTFMHACFFLTVPTVALVYFVNSLTILWLVLFLCLTVILHSRPYITQKNAQQYFAISPLSKKLLLSDIEQLSQNELKKIIPFRVFEHDDRLLNWLKNN